MEAEAELPGRLTIDCSGFELDRTPAATMTHGVDWLNRPERISEERPDELIEALQLRAGMRVADIGAGAGYHTIRIAPRVGPTGRVYATDIQPKMLELIAERTREMGNVETILASQEGTGLPSGAIDLALMVDVYHELSDPETLLDDLRDKLSDGGRLVLVEFRAHDPDVPIRPDHTMTVWETVCELQAYGWRLVRRYDELPWQNVLFFEPVRDEENR